MPATALEGMTTSSGWNITNLISEKLGSGGNFCCRYTAESPDGETGFLKAMDLTRAPVHDIRALQTLINTYVFEQDILYYCKDRKMTRVVTPLDAGQIAVPSFHPPLNQVYYVIFENADGDLRQRHLENPAKSWGAAFKTLHHVAVGAHQLHLAGIAHQDIKPSNILCFNDTESKISDLGRVTDTNATSPFSSEQFTGDRSYAPPEVRYGIMPNEFSDRYYADVYMVGSLAYHLVTNAQIAGVQLIEARRLMGASHAVSYADAVPFLQTSFSTILQRYHQDCTNIFGSDIADKLTNIVSEMCNPDMSKRGSPKHTSKIPKLSMTRYIGKFANLVRTAHINGFK